MEFFHIYMVAAMVIFCLFGIAIVNIIFRKSSMEGADKPTYIEEYIEKKNKELVRARSTTKIETFLIMKVILPTILCWVIYFSVDQKWMSLVFGALGFFIPDMLLEFKLNSEKNKFENRFVRALGQMASSLHSGLTIEQSIDSVISCELLHETIKDDFMLISSKLKLGTSLSDAFYEYADITGSKDAFDVATAITIMANLGGDAGVAVEKIQKNIEDRLLYRKKRESMMTESKMIMIASDVVPIVILVGAFIFMHDAMMTYITDSSKLIILSVIVGILGLGSVVVHKLLNNKIDAT